jgi:hypothetical protein
MSEYWKSTPKYWCKFCKVFVRDTKFEKQQHEATGRHQGGIQKSLRDLHRGKEQEAREKDRAVNEVARLKGQVAGKPVAGSSNVAESSIAGGTAPTREVKKLATAEDRKRQMAQLAAMGIGIPDEYRKDVAMKGEWTVVATHRAGGAGKKEDEKNPDALAKGVRKRKHDDAADEEYGHLKTRKGWGTDTKTYPGKSADIDLDNLLKEPIKLKQDEVKHDEVKKEHSPSPKNLDEGHDPIPATISESNEPAKTSQTPASTEPLEAEAPSPAVVFKKRKKPIRNI